MRVASPTYPLYPFWTIPHLTKTILAGDINSLNLLVLVEINKTCLPMGTIIGTNFNLIYVPQSYTCHLQVNIYKFLQYVPSPYITTYVTISTHM